jgi:hypothetical protein
MRPIEPVMDPPQETINPDRLGCPCVGFELHNLGVVCIPSDASRTSGKLHLVPFTNIKEIVFEDDTVVEFTAEPPPVPSKLRAA